MRKLSRHFHVGKNIRFSLHFGIFGGINFGKIPQKARKFLPLRPFSISLNFAQAEFFTLYHWLIINITSRVTNKIA